MVDLVSSVFTLRSSSASAPQGSPTLSPTQTRQRQPVPDPQDLISIGTLAQSLTGRAAKAFGYLDGNSREILSRAVESGRITAQEVGVALRALTDDALFERYRRERPLTEEQQELYRQEEETQQSQEAASDAADSLVRDYRRLTNEFNNLPESDKSNDDIRKTFFAETGVVFDRLKETGEVFNNRIFAGIRSIEIDIRNFTDIKLDEEDTDNDAPSFVTQQSLDALAKLPPELDVVSYRRAFRRFAADFDIPGLGRGTPPAGRPGSPNDAAEAASVPAPSQAQSRTTAVTDADIAGLRERTDPVGRLASRLSELTEGGTASATTGRTTAIFGLLEEALTQRDGPGRSRSLVTSLKADLARGDGSLQRSLENLLDLFVRSRQETGSQRDRRPGPTT